METAWLDAIARWREKKATDERNLAALRLYAEMGRLGDAADELPPPLREPSALVNATLFQFEVPPDMEAETVLLELVQELDVERDDLSEEAAAALNWGVALHVAHRQAERAAQLHEALHDLVRRDLG